MKWMFIIRVSNAIKLNRIENILSVLCVPSCNRMNQLPFSHELRISRKKPNLEFHSFVTLASSAKKTLCDRLLNGLRKWVWYLPNQSPVLFDQIIVFLFCPTQLFSINDFHCRLVQLNMELQKIMTWHRQNIARADVGAFGNYVTLVDCQKLSRQPETSSFQFISRIEIFSSVSTTKTNRNSNERQNAASVCNMRERAWMKF